MNKDILISVMIFIVIISSISVQATDVPPQPMEDGIWVIDDANVLTELEFNNLNKKCNDIYLESGRPIVVLTIESYEQQNAEVWDKSEYAKYAFDEYGINDDKGDDKAILVFMSEQDREFWIELGGGYSGDGLDGYVQSIFDNDVKPFLAEDRWSNGLNAAIEGLRPILEGGEIIIPDFDWSDKMWIVDDGDILSDNEEIQLNLIINEIELDTSCPIIILTINGLEEKNASLLTFDSYISKVFDEYEIPDCGIIWGIFREEMEWGEFYYQIAVSSGEQYDGDWDTYLQNQPWQMSDDLYYEMAYSDGRSLIQVTTDMTEYSEKAFNNDGFEVEEWVKINLVPVLLFSLILFLGIGLFVNSVPKKLEFRRRKEETFQNTAIINRAIMSNLAGDSNIRKEWNGVFKNMTDSEIKSMRQLDKKLKNEDVNISLDKYETELKMIKEIYNLHNARSNYAIICSIIISFFMAIMLILSYLSSSTWAMGAQVVNGDDIFMAIFGTIFIGAFIVPIGLSVGAFSGRGVKSLETEMALILGLPLIYYRDKNYETYGEESYRWNYQGMNNSFKSSSGSTTSEIASSSSSSSSGGGGFDGGGGGGGGGGGNF